MQGPISAFHKSLAKAEWTFKSPLVLCDAELNTYHLPPVCPKRVVKSFSDDLQKCFLSRYTCKLNAKFHSDEPEDLHENGIFFDPLRTLYKKLPFREAQTLLAITSDGIFTDFDLFCCGYDLDPTCSQCGLARDTVYHRCFSCSSVSARAEEALGSSLFNSIIAAGDQSLLANRCLASNPKMSSRPSASTLFECINMGAGDKFNIGEGDVFGDGSCLFSNCRPLSRAGFAVAQVDNQGNILKAIFGCIPRSLPQTSLVAEYAAFTTFIDNIDEGRYVGNCQEVIDRYNDPIAGSVEVSNPMACLWKTISNRHGVDLSSRGTGVFKTKAHRREIDVEEGIDRIRFN